METKYEERAREIGEEHGRNAASWVELDEATAEAIDRAQNVFDVLEPSGPLSGEWADGYSVDRLLVDVGIGDYTEPQLDDTENYQRDEVANAYEDAYWQGFSESVEAQVERLRGPILTLGEDAYRVAGFHDGIAFRYVGQTFGGMARMVMIGDDREHIVEPEDLTPLDELAYCASCGQVGCTADGRDR